MCQIIVRIKSIFSEESLTKARSLKKHERKYKNHSAYENQSCGKGMILLNDISLYGNISNLKFGQFRGLLLLEVSTFILLASSIELLNRTTEIEMSILYEG